MEALTSATKNKSLLVIAHRLSTIQDSDRILVIDNGCVSEEGTHQELLDQNGLYKQMWDTQINTPMGPTITHKSCRVRLSG